MSASRKLLRNKIRKEVGNKNLKYSFSRFQFLKIDNKIESIKKDKDISKTIKENILNQLQVHRKFLERRKHSRDY